jgi:hypothetical protein
LQNFERQRLWGWSFAQAVLSAWWCFEDGVNCHAISIAFARILAQIE